MAKPPLNPAEVQAKLREIRAAKGGVQPSPTSPSLPVTLPTSTTGTRPPLNPADVQAKLKEIRSQKTTLVPEQKPKLPLAKKPTILETTKKISKGFYDAGTFVRDFNVGAVKGAASTAAGLASVGESTLNKASEKLFPNIGIKGSDKTVGTKLEEGVLKPKNTAQRIGFGTEQIAEFFVPTGAVSKAATGLEAVTKVSKIPKFLKGAVNLTGRAGLEGLAAAGITSAQEGEVNKTSVTAGLFSAAAPALEKSVGALAKKLGNVAFSSAIPSTITQRAKDIKTGLDIGEAVSNTGVSLTRKSLVKKLEQQISGLGRSLGQALDDSLRVNPTAVYSMDDIATQVQKSMTDEKVLKGLKATPIELPKVQQIIDDTLEAYRELYKGKVLNIKDVQQLKVALGDGLETVFQKALDAPLKAKPLTEIALRSKLRQIVEKNVPAAAALNKQLAPLFEATGRLGKKGSYSGYLTDVIAGGFASGGASQLINDPVEFFRNAAIGIATKRLGTSTAAKTLTGTVAKDIGKIVSSPAFLQMVRKLIEQPNKE